MKIQYSWLVWFIYMALSIPAQAESSSAERVLWEVKPIPVHIQRNFERIIHFPEEVRYWLPDQIQKKVSVIAANGVLYIRATESFPVTRIRVQGLSSQQMFLLDLDANDTPSIDEELIVMTSETIINQASNSDSENKEDDWRVRLTRYAAQSLYAPERLLMGDQSIRRIPLEVDKTIPLIRTGIIEALPIASWRGGGLFVTAIRLRNLQDKTLELEFTESTEPSAVNLSQLLRGHWLTITVQHNSLDVMGSDKDTTTVYLVSKQSFIESLGMGGMSGG